MSDCDHVWLLSITDDCAVCSRCGKSNYDYSTLRAVEERLRSAENVRRVLEHDRNDSLSPPRTVSRVSIGGR